MADTLCSLPLRQISRQAEFSGAFVRDLNSGTTSLVSVSNTGAAADSGISVASISANGRYVVFATSADNMGFGEAGTNQAIYVRDLQLGTTERVDISSGGSGANNNSYGPVISADGRFVAFVSYCDESRSLAQVEAIAYVRDRKTSYDAPCQRRYGRISCRWCEQYFNQC
jgi:hypothetical protein